jgi:hypothetical protein
MGVNKISSISYKAVSACPSDKWGLEATWGLGEWKVAQCSRGSTINILGEFCYLESRRLLRKSINLYQTKRYHVPEDGDLRNNGHEHPTSDVLQTQRPPPSTVIRQDKGETPNVEQIRWSSAIPSKP